MKKLYIVFDQIPDIKSGGLLATYINLVSLLKDDYDIKVISVFNRDVENKEIFKNIDVICLSTFNLDNRFYKLIDHLKNMKVKKFFHSLVSLIYFFAFIPFGRKNIKKIINKDDLVIAVAPAAAIFMSKTIQFILEIHINFEYFWGNNILGRMQSKIMTKPTLTVFRNKKDAEKGSRLFPSSYIYNFIDDSEIINPIFDYSNRKNRILFMGRLEEQKDPLRLLDCAKLLKDINSNFTLDIYGDGQLKDEMNKRIFELDLQENVFLKGFVQDKSIYNQYSLLWLTSKFEGFGLVIVEAKANKVPTISVDWGPALYEIVSDDKDGYIVHSNEEFVEKTNVLLNDKEQLEEFSNNAFLNFHKYFTKAIYKDRIIYLLSTYKEYK